MRKGSIRFTLSALLFAFGVLGAMLFALSSSAEGQQTKTVPRIGFLIPGSSATYAVRIEALRQGLREFGYVEGKDITIEYRYAEGRLELLPNLMAELIGLKLDLLVTAGSEAIAVAKAATTEIPIVMANSGDAVGFGFVASLARPGGNITGLTALTRDLIGKSARAT